jgi:hypothetical protein
MRGNKGRLRIGGGARVYYRQYQEPAGFTMIASQTAIAGTSEVLLWPYQFTAIPAQALVPGQQIEVTAWGIMSTAASAEGTFTINPRWGTTTGGVTLGLSDTSITLPASLSNVPWYLKFSATVRTVSDTATSSTVVGAGFLVSTGLSTATAGGTSIMGGTVATVDTVSSQGLVFGVTLGSASDGMTTQGIAIEALN